MTINNTRLYLVERWHAVRGDTAELRDPVFHTGRRRDVRLYDAVRTIAVDPSRGATAAASPLWSPKGEDGFKKLENPNYRKLVLRRFGCR
jgi:hypothetical protein